MLSLAPAILMMMTSFTRMVVVLSFLRHALGTQQMPPNQILIGLALFLTFFIMAPVWQQVNQQALQPYMAEQITQEEALDQGAWSRCASSCCARPARRTWRCSSSMAKMPRPHNAAGRPHPRC